MASEIDALLARVDDPALRSALTERVALPRHPIAGELVRSFDGAEVGSLYTAPGSRPFG